ncbi:MAG TPA: MFS transporter [Acidobacteriaceae bacterium]|jgi:SHS family lactate transporter-like MFS transporter
MNPATYAQIFRRAPPRWQLAVSSGILGWVLDAFDFFVVIFLLNTLAAHFHVGKAAIVVSLTVTLAGRPLGALLFGALADRFGRRRVIVLCVIFFSSFTVLSGFAPSYRLFLVIRGLYGVGMGGYWGIGATYTMESAPPQWRGMLSGIMQSGYPLGYLLAAIAMQLLVPAFGWRSLFLVGTGFAALIILLALLAPESESWEARHRASLGQVFHTVAENFGIFVYLLLAMTIMSCLSHGTQDLYPDFLRSIAGLSAHKLLGMNIFLAIPVLYNLCAIAGGPILGHLSEKIGRRHAIMLALVISLISIPAWAFAHSIILLALASCFMQVGVQGAFGVIPAHLTELSPATSRGLFPGMVYQFGVLMAAPAVSVEYLLRNRLGYPVALASFEGCVILLLLVTFALGPERLGRDFHDDPDAGKRGGAFQESPPRT